MSSSRDAILEQVRGLRHASPPVPRRYEQSGSRNAHARIELFGDRVADYRAEVRLSDASNIAVTLASIVAAHGAMTLAVPSRLPDEWRPRGSIVGDQLTALELDAIDGVITGCTVAIAATGTVVMTSGPSEGPRKLTLVPDLHICIVQTNQIVETVPEGIRIVADLVRAEHRPVTLISGPSATSDIELSRVEGVHGPRQLVVLIVRS